MPSRSTKKEISAKGGIFYMTKKIFSIALCLAVLFTCGVCFAACGDDSGTDTPPDTPSLRDSTKWFSQEELVAKGLDGLVAPSGLTGEMTTDVNWFCDGYYFSQLCPDVDTFTKNAQTYFEYFTKNYSGRFGVPKLEMVGTESNETWYKIQLKTDLADYFDDNPSQRYKIYYIKDNKLDNGYFAKGCVWIFDIRYEFDTEKNAYLFKIFIESADANNTGTHFNYYKV